MDTLHTVLRTIRGETQPRRDHLAVFREFLAHLDRIGRRAAPPPRIVKAARPQASAARAASNPSLSFRGAASAASPESSTHGR